MEGDCNHGYRSHWTWRVMARSVMWIASCAECEDSILTLIDTIAGIRGFPVVTCTAWQRTAWIDNLILRYPKHQYALGHQLHLCAQSRGLAICHRSDGFISTSSNPLELILTSDQWSCHGCITRGDLLQVAQYGGFGSLRSRGATRIRRLPGLLKSALTRGWYEPMW